MKLQFLVAAIPLAASGCAATLPDVLTTSDHPATVSEARPVHYHSPIGDYTHRMPVDPRPWREQNDAQAKKEGE